MRLVPTCFSRRDESFGILLDLERSTWRFDLRSRSRSDLSRSCCISLDSSQRDKRICLHYKCMCTLYQKLSTKKCDVIVRCVALSQSVIVRSPVVNNAILHWHRFGVFLTRISYGCDFVKSHLYRLSIASLPRSPHLITAFLSKRSVMQYNSIQPTVFFPKLQLKC